MKKTNTLFALVLLASLPVVAQTWSTSGNTVAAGEYIGTRNAANLELKTANTSRIIIGPSGNINFPGFTGSGTRLVQTSPAGLLSPFALSTAANVLCGDGIGDRSILFLVHSGSVLARICIAAIRVVWVLG